MANFYDLAVRIRIAIYRLALQDVRMQILMTSCYQNSFLAPGILTANNQHHPEIRAALFEYATVSIRVGWQMRAIFFNEPHIFQLRKIEFQFRIKLASPKDMDAMIAQLPELKEMTLSGPSRVRVLPDLETLTQMSEQSPQQQRARTIVQSAFSEGSQKNWIKRVFQRGAMEIGKRRIKATESVSQEYRKAVSSSAKPQVSRQMMYK